MLEPGLRVLDERERTILHLRFFEGPDAVADRPAGRDLADARLATHPARPREDPRGDRRSRTTHDAPRWSMPRSRASGCVRTLPLRHGSPGRSRPPPRLPSPSRPLTVLDTASVRLDAPEATSAPRSRRSPGITHPVPSSRSRWSTDRGSGVGRSATAPRSCSGMLGTARLGRGASELGSTPGEVGLHGGGRRGAGFRESPLLPPERYRLASLVAGRRRCRRARLERLRCDGPFVGRRYLGIAGWSRPPSENRWSSSIPGTSIPRAARRERVSSRRVVDRVRAVTDPRWKSSEQFEADRLEERRLTLDESRRGSRGRAWRATRSLDRLTEAPGAAMWGCSSGGARRGRRCR